MEWIKITDKKPALNKMVIFTRIDGQIYVGKRFIKRCNRQDVELYRLGLSDCKEDKVVAWMPLSEPYKERKDD